MKALITLSLLLLSSAVMMIAQTKSTEVQAGLDSLYAVWQDENNTDSLRCMAYDQYIGIGFLFNQPDSAFVLAEVLIDYAQDMQYPLAKGLAYNIQGASFAVRNNDREALNYYQRSINVNEEIGNKGGIARTLSNIGNLYVDQGNSTQALNYFERSLKINEEIGKKGGIARSLGHIGKIYFDQSNSTRALDHFNRSLKLYEEAGDKRGIASSLSFKGVIYMNDDKRPQALDLFERAIKIEKELGNDVGVAKALNNIGFAYLGQDSFQRARDYFHLSIELYDEIENKRGVAHTSGNMGFAYNELGEHKKAIQYCKRGLRISEEIGKIKIRMKACSCLYGAYKSMGNYREALVYLERMQVIEDSLNRQETSKKLQQMELAKVMMADSLQDEQERQKVQMAHELQLVKKNKQRNLFIGSGLFMLLLAFSFFGRWRYVKKSRDAISKEKDRSENLLLNILPAEIAEELKSKGSADARDYDQVSILFTDFKEFTQLSEKLSAKELVAELNYCFKAFDELCEKHQIEKIKTLGDSYMAAGGLPVLRQDSVKNVVLAALEMIEFVIQRKKDKEAAGQIPFEMRAGIHTGNVVAGIVGVKKFQYDVWGDTVNVASRMESHGDIGKVNISEATYKLIKDYPEFTFQHRGKIEAKGKGEIDMYFVRLKNGPHV